MYKTIKKYFFILILFLLMNQCVSYDYSIIELPYKHLTFSELPEKIKNFFYNPKPFEIISEEGYNLGVGSLVCLDSINYYKLEVVNTIIGPWIDYMNLIDTKNNIRYRIETGTPMPYVILDGKIYIVGIYNVLTIGKDFNDLRFICYSLVDGSVPKVAL